MANNWNPNFIPSGYSDQGYTNARPAQEYGRPAQSHGSYGGEQNHNNYPGYGSQYPDSNVNSNYSKDQEEEAAIARWQAGFEHKDSAKDSTAKFAPTSRREANEESKRAAQAGDVTVLREAGGKKWQDKRLTEWDENHFRLFVGNLAGEVTDDLLYKEFKVYGSVEKTRVIRDQRTSKSKGFGFVSFSNGDDYLRAAREMQGKYIGSHPVTISRAKTNVKPVHVEDANKKINKDKHKDRGQGGHAQTGAGVHKNKKKDKKSLANKYGLTPIA